MKKLFLLATILVATTVGISKAQNVQMHYNLGPHVHKELKGLPSFKTTLEHLSGDKWGQTFYFVDLLHTKNGFGEAYMEIARELLFWKAPVSLHLEYNAGINKYFSINNTYLGGLSYLWRNRSGAAFTVSMMYRHDQGLSKPHNMQLTGTWMWNSWNRVFTLSGFADLWTSQLLGGKSNVTFIAEPQFWINCNQFVGISDYFNLSLGSEVRLSYNFREADKFYVEPTLAMKWTF